MRKLRSSSARCSAPSRSSMRAQACAAARAVGAAAAGPGACSSPLALGRCPQASQQAGCCLHRSCHSAHQNHTLNAHLLACATGAAVRLVGPGHRLCINWPDVRRPRASCVAQGRVAGVQRTSQEGSELGSALTAHLNSWRASWMLPSSASSTPQACAHSVGTGLTAWQELKRGQRCAAHSPAQEAKHFSRACTQCGPPSSGPRTPSADHPANSLWAGNTRREKNQGRVGAAPATRARRCGCPAATRRPAGTAPARAAGRPRAPPARPRPARAAHRLGRRARIGALGAGLVPLRCELHQRAHIQAAATATGQPARRPARRRGRAAGSLAGRARLPDVQVARVLLGRLLQQPAR